MHIWEDILEKAIPQLPYSLTMNRRSRALVTQGNIDCTFCNDLVLPAGTLFGEGIRSSRGIRRVGPMFVDVRKVQAICCIKEQSLEEWPSSGLFQSALGQFQ